MVKKLVIGRYYFNSLFRNEANKSFLDDLKNNPFIKQGVFEFAIGNFKSMELGGTSFVAGTFGRVRSGALATIYDKAAKEFKLEKLPEMADVMVEFIIIPKYHMILVENDSILHPYYFAHKFKDIFDQTNSLADITIDFIFDRRDVYKTIQSWDRVDVVTFKKLRPSNPDSKPYFEDLEKLLKPTNSEDTEFKFVARKTDGNKGQGLNYESDLIKQGIALSSYGYGEAKIQGIKNEEEVEVQTKKFFRKVEIDFSDEGALKKITQTVEEIQEDEKEK